MVFSGKTAPRDVNAVRFIRAMRVCSRACPAFSLCPLMPLSIQPVAVKERVCLMNQGPEELRRVYMHLFIDGQSGVVDEIKGTVLEYGKLLREVKTGISVKERLRHLKELNGMMVVLHKILGASGEEEPGGERVEVMGEIEEMEDDPESLVHSEKLRELIPSMVVEKVEPGPEPEPVVNSQI